ncbi:MAG: hypothetical protein H6581_15990 [Bacteroidia bacterium]|nr:hypothetical protein [Bacteroidia bacterium]
MAKIIGLKKDGFYDQALEELDLVIAHSGDARRIMELLQEGRLGPPLPPDCPPDLISAVADLCYEKSILLENTGNLEESLDWQIKTLHLLLNSLLAERHILKLKEENRAEELIRKIGSENLPEKVFNLASQYFRDSLP